MTMEEAQEEIRQMNELHGVAEHPADAIDWSTWKVPANRLVP